MALVRYTPFTDFDRFPGLTTFQDTMNRLFSEPNGRPWVPAVDIRETENELIVKADVPDLKFEDIDVRLENGTLTLRGERKFEEETNRENYHRVERHYGDFMRSFTVPMSVDATKISAEFKNGVLTVTLAKREEAVAKQIDVKIG